MKSYKALATLVKREITRAISQPSKRGIITSRVGGKATIGRTDLSEMVAQIIDNLGELIKPRIITGLQVTANDPPNEYINIALGTGTANGKKLVLGEDITMQVTLGGEQIWYVNLNVFGGVNLSTATFNDQLAIAKIIIPKASTVAIQDDKPDDGYHGWIVSGRDLLFDNDFEIDDETIVALRNVMDRLLADNLVGNIKLSEGLKIINTQGTLEMDSKEIRILYPSGNVGSKFNKLGVFFYDEDGNEYAHYSSDEARVGNILVKSNSIESDDYEEGVSGFIIKDTGDVEFNDALFRGTIYASGGVIGGFTLTPTKLYGGIIQTGENVGIGQSGVVLDIDGLRGYSDILGKVFDLPTDGSPPHFSAGVIEETLFELTTASVIRTSATVGDGTANSAGILINNTGFYACEANQLLADANLKILIDGTIDFYEVTEARGSKADLDTRLSIILEDDGTLKESGLGAKEIPSAKIDLSAIAQVVTNAVQPRCRLYLAADYSLPNNAYQSLNFTAEEYDVGGCHDLGANQDRITIPAGAGGCWAFHAVLVFDAANLPNARLGLSKGLIEKQEDWQVGVAGNKTYLHAHYIDTAASPGDIYRIRCNQNSGAPLDIISGSEFTTFTAIKLW